MPLSRRLKLPCGLLPPSLGLLEQEWRQRSHWRGCISWRECGQSVNSIFWKYQQVVWINYCPREFCRFREKERVETRRYQKYFNIPDSRSNIQHSNCFSVLLSMYLSTPHRCRKYLAEIMWGERGSEGPNELHVDITSISITYRPLFQDRMFSIANSESARQWVNLVNENTTMWDSSKLLWVDPQHRKRSISSIWCLTARILLPFFSSCCLFAFVWNQLVLRLWRFTQLLPSTSSTIFVGGNLVKLLKTSWTWSWSERIWNW